MQGKGDVLQHDHHVSHCHPCEEKVDGVAPHVLVCQHQDVDHVEEGAQDTDSHSQVAMHWFIQSLGDTL